MNSLKTKGIKVVFDQDEKNRPGFKFAEYELKGVHIRIGIGLRDIEQGVVEVARRDTKEKKSVSIDEIDHYVINLLDDIQNNLFSRAKKLREDNTHIVDEWSEFENIMETKPGFIYAHWDGTTETELAIKEKTKATIRCIPEDSKTEPGKCIFSGKPSSRRVLFAKAY